VELVFLHLFLESSAIKTQGGNWRATLTISNRCS